MIPLFADALAVSNGEETDAVEGVGAVIVWNEFIDRPTLMGSATLVAPDRILTAAHVLTTIGPLVESPYYRAMFVTGPDVRTGKTGFVDLVELWPHEAYSYDDPMTPDIGMARLAWDLDVEPVALDLGEVTDAWEGREVGLLGYGAIEHGITGNGIKRAGAMWVYDWDELYLMTEGDPDLGQSACEGDSGSPMLDLGGDAPVVFGVVTYASPETAAFPCGKYGGGSRIDVFADWIDAHMPPPPEDEPADTDVEAPRGCATIPASRSLLLVFLASVLARRR